jgi:hypothetical protein
MPKYEIVYTETRTRTAVVIAPCPSGAYDFFHNDFCAANDFCEEWEKENEFELVEESDGRDGWKYYDEDTKVTEQLRNTKVTEVKDD